jgi:hypothetical protein
VPSYTYIEPVFIFLAIKPIQRSQHITIFSKKQKLSLIVRLSPLRKQSTCIINMNATPPSRQVFRQHGSWIAFGKYKDITDEEMVHFFGATAIVCVAVWRLLGDKGLLRAYSKPRHLIVALYSNKKYPTVTELERIAGVSRKTAKKQIDPIRRAMVGLLPFVVRISLCCLFSFYDDMN